MKLTDKLLRERTEYGKHTDNKTWIEIQKKLLSDHEFLTKTAQASQKCSCGRSDRRTSGIQRIIQIPGEKCIKYSFKNVLLPHILIVSNYGKS